MMKRGGAARAEPAVGDLGDVAIDVYRWLLPVIALGTILAPLNSTTAAVAFLGIRSAFGASVAEAAWLVTIYLVAMTVAQPIGGWLGDTLGRRPVYLIGLAWFGIAGVGCALSPNLLALILFRVQQALAGAICLVIGVALTTGTLGGPSLLVISGTLALMGIGLGLPDAATQESAFEPIPNEHIGSAGGVYTTIRYLGTVIGSTVFAVVFVTPPRAGERGPFMALFAGLTAVALLGGIATARVARWMSVES